MTKNEFLKELEKKLKDLSAADMKKSVEFYSEMLDDLMEDGISEEEAIESLGNIDDIAQQIKSNQSFDVPQNTARKPAWFNIVIFLCAFPIWFALVAVYIALWAVLVSLYIADLALVFAGILGIAAFPFLLGSPASAFFTLGEAAAAIGLSVLLFFGLNILGKLYFKFTRWLLIKIQYFLTKEAA